MRVKTLLVPMEDAALIYCMPHFFAVGANTRAIPNTLNRCVTVSATHRAGGGDRCWLCSRGGVDRDTRWRRWWVEQWVNIDGVVTCTWFFMCSSVIRKKRVIAVASFLNDDGLSFNHLFGDGRVQRSPKNGGRVNWRYLSLSKSKIQDDRCDNGAEWLRT